MKYLLSYLIICACMINPEEGYAQNHQPCYFMYNMMYCPGDPQQSQPMIVPNYVPRVTVNPHMYAPKQERQYQWRCELANGCVPNYSRGD